MKNIYLTIAFAISILFVNAQSQSTKQGPGFTVPQSQQTQVKKILKQQNNYNTNNSRWYDYASSIKDFYGAESILYRTFLFPDTAISCLYGTTVGTPWIHSIGTIIDPAYAFFNDEDGNISLKKFSLYS